MDLIKPTDLVRDIDGRMAAPSVRDLYARMRELAVPSLDELGIDRARAAVEASIRGQSEGSLRVACEHGNIPGPRGAVATRLYRPQQTPEMQQSGTIVYLHGGGWVTGSLATADATCRDLAAITGFDVLSVGYRRSPNHRHPTALDDTIAAVEYAASSAALSTERLVVAGDSAGGYLAYATAAAVPDTITDLILLYPAVRPPGSTPPSSWIENANDPVLPARTMQWFWDQFLGDTGAVNSLPKVDRLRARTLIFNCGLDILRNESATLASKAADAGASVLLETYPGAPHGFLAFTRRLPFGADAIQRIGRWLA